VGNFQATTFTFR